MHSLVVFPGSLGVRVLSNRLVKHHSFFIFLAVLACLMPLRGAQAVTPAPDGGYAGQNTAEGSGALGHLTTGEFNTALGSNALLQVTTGNNTATGAHALSSMQTAHDNTATGEASLLLTTTGSNNTATGSEALRSNTTGDSNTANGCFASYRLAATNDAATVNIVCARSSAG